MINEIVDTINKHIDSGKACYVPQAIVPITWDLVVKHLQECADGKYKGGSNGVLSFQLGDAEQIPQVEVVMDSLNEHLNLKIFDATIFASFTTERQEKTKQAVHSNLLIWSLTGDMCVNLYPSMAYDEEPFYSVELNKGDLMFIPAEMPHEIDPTAARALVAFGIEVESGKNYIEVEDKEELDG